MNTTTDSPETDELLTLFYFNDGLSNADRRALEAAMATDEVLAARYARISAELSSIRAEDAAPLPDDMLQRFHETIDRAARAESMATSTARRRQPIWSFLLGASAAAVLLVTIIAVVQTSRDVPSETGTLIAATEPAVATNPATLKRGLAVYFRDSRQELGDWPEASDIDRTSMIIALVGQNRRYEKLAAQNQVPELARVLRAFEPILLRLAAADITPEESQRLRDQLAFELNVMLTKLTHEASEPARPFEQET